MNKLVINENGSTLNNNTFYNNNYMLDNEKRKKENAVKAVEEEIEKLEEELKRKDEELLNPEIATNSAKLNELGKERDKIHQMLDIAYDKWEEVSGEL